MFNPNGEFENGFYSEDGEFYPNSSWRCMTLNYKQGDTFTRSGGSWGGIVTFWNNGTFISGFNSYSLTTTIPNGANEVKFACRYPFTGDEQLEYGTTATSYVLHAEQNYPFTFAEGQRGMQGTQLLDDGIHQKHKQRVFDGTENFSVNPNYTTENILCVQITINDVKPATNQCLCSHFKYYSVSTIKNVFRFAGNFLLFTVDRNEYATLEDFKTKFANEYANGTPVIVEYELAESELENNIIPYNTTQQAQHNAIKEASSYDDITIISSESDELGFDMNVVAVADANKVINSLDTRLLALESEV